MYALPFSEVSKLKAEVDKRFSMHLHFHDRCGGQFCSLEEKNDDLRKYIENYFSDMNLKAIYSENGLEFTVEAQNE